METVAVLLPNQACTSPNAEEKSPLPQCAATYPAVTTQSFVVSYIKSRFNNHDVIYCKSQDVKRLAFFDAVSIFSLLIMR